MANDKVTQVLIDRILKDVEKNNTLPWLTPWLYRYAFNYKTENAYRGINRWLLPTGEYMTVNQLNTYNKENGTNYRFIKGIEWFPVLFMKKVDVKVMRGELSTNQLGDIIDAGGKIVRIGNNNYFYDDKSLEVKRTYLCRRFSSVADIKWFKDEKGSSPPSKIETGEIVFEHEVPEGVVSKYTESEKIKIIFNVVNQAYFRYSTNSVHIPKKEDFKSTENFYYILYHELAHSTGIESRLNRDTIAPIRLKDTTRDTISERGKEELIAELCACLLCIETGLYNLDKEDEASFLVYRNSQAYLNHWYSYLKEGKDDLVFVASEAEKAFKFILGEHVSIYEEAQDKIK